MKPTWQTSDGSVQQLNRAPLFHEPVAVQKELL